MVSALLSWDLQTFRILNEFQWPGAMSFLVSALARTSLWVGPIAGLVVCLLILGGERERTYVILAFLTLAVTELIGSGVLKPLIARPRPCQVLDNVRLLGGCTGSHAMPSGHAANSFAQAVVLGAFYRPTLLLSLPVSTVIALSRVTDGKHYPLDILVGALLGIAVAAAVVRWVRPVIESLVGRMAHLFSVTRFLEDLDSRKRSRSGTVFGVLLLLATALRLWYGLATELSPEEAISWKRAHHLQGSTWMSATPSETLAWVGTRMLGHTELGVRLGVLGALLLTSLVLFSWGKRAFPWSRWSGTLAGFGLLAAPLFAIGGIHRPGLALSLLFWTGSLASLDAALSGTGRNRWAIWGVWGLCAGLAIRTHPGGLLLLPVSGLYLFAAPAGERRWLRRPSFYFGLALLLVLGAFPPNPIPPAAGQLPSESFTGGLGALLQWHLTNFGPLLCALTVWGVLGTGLRVGRDGSSEYISLVGACLLIGLAVVLWVAAGGIRSSWTAIVWVPAWMATVGVSTEILRRGNRQSERLIKVLTLVLVAGFLQTTVQLNDGLFRKLDLQPFWKPDSAALNWGWRDLARRSLQSLGEMKRGSVILADTPGTAAELSFYTRPEPTGTRFRIDVLPPPGRPFLLEDGRDALLVVTGETDTPPPSVQRLFRAWEREKGFRAARTTGGTIRSASFFRLLGYREAVRRTDDPIDGENGRNPKTSE